MSLKRVSLSQGRNRLHQNWPGRNEGCRSACNGRRSSEEVTESNSKEDLMVIHAKIEFRAANVTCEEIVEDADAR